MRWVAWFEAVIGDGKKRGAVVVVVDGGGGGMRSENPLTVVGVGL